MWTMYVGCTLALGPLLACGSVPADAESTGSTSSAVAIAGLFSTGVDATGGPLANGNDPHYVLSSLDPTRRGPNAPVVPLAAGWTANTANSKWIGAAADGNGSALFTYTYTTTFSLTGADAATATLSGTWACDDSCTLVLNGTHLVATYAVPAWQATAAFTVPAGSGFVAGTNTLAFVVSNSGGGPTGLQVVSLTAAANCTADAVCAAGQFCNTQSGACTAKLPNGTAIPTIPGHAPVLDATCSAAVGTAVCVSGLCDTKNSECGLANGDGPCVAAATGSTVCQSGSCSVNLTCEPAGGCNVDGDCAGGLWCNESTHVCTAKLANGSPIPTDATHTNPTLTGVCTTAAGTLVCASAVCDPVDNECGIATGDPGCTAGTATECRSGACSLLGTCEPLGGCNEDADCQTKRWCNESTHACTAQLPNGALLPSDPPHTNPTLNATCSTGAATLVCVSGLCNSTSNTCVACTAANASACAGLTPVCGPTGVCIAELDAGVDAGGAPDAGDAGLDSGVDAGAGLTSDGGADAGTDAGAAGKLDAGDSSTSTDSGADAQSDASTGDDAGDDASGGDDATTGARDASRGGQNSGAGVSGELEGGGISCTVSWSRSSESSGGPLLMLAIALGAAFGRKRRNR